jgi:hypothetical protein
MATKIDLDVSTINKRLSQVTDEVFSPRFFSRLANLARSIVYKRVKSGYGVASTGSGRRQKLRALAQSTVEVRKGKIAIRHQKGTTKKIILDGVDDRPRELGDGFAPSRSNLTFSGQLLDSIEIDVGKYGFAIFIPNTKRRRYNQNQKTTITNQQLAIFVQDAGRNFFELTKPEVDIIIATINDFIKSTIRKKGL